MLISDFTCGCGAEYERAESTCFKRRTKAASYRCEICGERFEQRDPETLVAFRLVFYANASTVVRVHKAA